MTSELKNPMRFSLGNRTIDVEKYNVDITELEIVVSEGQLYVHWEDD